MFGGGERSSKEEDARKERFRRLREALNEIEGTHDMRTLSKKLESLRRGFPESREGLLEGTRRFSPRVRTISLSLLGELDAYSHLRQFSVAREDATRLERPSSPSLDAFCQAVNRSRWPELGSPLAGLEVP